LAGVFIISTTYYIVKGRKEFTGPVVNVMRD
jgi:choline transport protein